VDISKVKPIGVNEKISPKAKKLSILIVDHEINNCNVLALTFTKLNYYVRVTTTPNSALEYLKNCKVDIVITNLELPNMNGMEFAKELRIRYGFDVIIYVILNDISLQSKINLNLFNGILIKPITLEQIKKIF
jgi:DNA-binding response OmpR family regulator